MKKCSVFDVKKWRILVIKILLITKWVNSGLASQEFYMRADYHKGLLHMTWGLLS